MGWTDWRKELAGLGAAMQAAQPAAGLGLGGGMGGAATGMGSLGGQAPVTRRPVTVGGLDAGAGGNAALGGVPAAIGGVNYGAQSRIGGPSTTGIGSGSGASGAAATGAATRSGPIGSSAITPASGSPQTGARAAQTGGGAQTTGGKGGQYENELGAKYDSMIANTIFADVDEVTAEALLADPQALLGYVSEKMGWRQGSGEYIMGAYDPAMRNLLQGGTMPLGAGAQLQNMDSYIKGRQTPGNLANPYDLVRSLVQGARRTRMGANGVEPDTDQIGGVIGVGGDPLGMDEFQNVLSILEGGVFPGLDERSVGAWKGLMNRELGRYKQYAIQSNMNPDMTFMGWMVSKYGDGLGLF